MNLHQTSRQAWYNRSSGALCLSVLALGLSYGMVSRAVFTGSLQQYSIAVLLLALAANRAIVAGRAWRSQ